jgi:hypothetical protein
MFGSEHNWLVSFSRPDHRRPQVRLANTSGLTVAVAVFCLVCFALQSAGPGQSGADHRPNVSRSVAP